MMLEIACFNAASAEIALRSKADRIEFCAGAKVGGTTPDLKDFGYLKTISDKPIFVMIRPRGGEFIYSDAEFAFMKKSIEDFKNAGADGFVFGILTPENQIDFDKNSELVALAGGTPCTFHRAIDRAENLSESVANLVTLGFRTVLTSGGAASAMEGKSSLKNLVEKFSGKIDILVGGGVRSENILELKKETGAQHFHSSALLHGEKIADGIEIGRLYNALQQ